MEIRYFSIFSIMHLIEHLQQIRDFRTQPDYPLWVVLLLVMMGTMSGYTDYRPLAEFVTRHQADLIALLQLPYNRLPSFSTIRRIRVRVDFVSFTAVFNAWVQEEFGEFAHHQIATDGKGIKVSVRDYDQSFQDFVTFVSAFSVTQGVVMGLEPRRNRQTSEIKTLEVLLDKLHLKGVCFSLDALHTQKKLSSKSLPVATTIGLPSKATNPSYLSISRLSLSNKQLEV